MTTTVTTTAPAATVPLTQRALLTVLTIREWQGRRRDRRITAAIAREHGAERHAGCYTKALLPKQYLRKIGQVRTEARRLHHELTLPWCNDGARILPVDLHLTFTERFGDLRRRFEAAVDDFLAAYDDAKRAAQASLGSLYSEDDYPTAARLRRSFGLELAFEPLPSTRDWRIDLPETAIAHIERDLEQRQATAQRAAMADLYRRLAAPVARMASTLAAPEKIFRDSLVGNLREICELLPHLNLDRDPALASLAEEIEGRLARLEPEQLRRNPVTRESAALDAAALLETIEARLASYTGQP
jgi:hypothetical protein